MNKRIPLVSIVILNWNKPQDTLLCIKSLRMQSYDNYEIIVVDNGSIDKSVELLSELEDITLIKNQRNRGFTGGHIDGLTKANGKYIFVLNNDSVVDKLYIETAISILEEDNSIGVVGGRAYDWDETEQAYENQDNFYSFQIINPITMEGIFRRQDKNFNHEVNWVSGSAMIIRKSVLDKVGYFYEPFFAYYEENDLFARIQTADYKIIYSPLLKIWHKKGASSSNEFQLDQLFKNRFIYSIRNLTKNDQIKFIKSYSKLGIRASYHHLLKKSSDPESQIYNQSLFRAMIYNSINWPRWYKSASKLKKRDSNGYTLVDRLKIEQVGVSFVQHMPKDLKSQDVLARFIKNIQYTHYNSEFILVCKRTEVSLYDRFIDTYSLGDHTVKQVIDKQQSPMNPLNLGWLSASLDYIWIITSDQLPSNATVISNCLAASGRKFITSVDNNQHGNVFVSRSILSILGGINDLNTKVSINNILYFTSKFKLATLINQPSVEIIKPNIDTQKNIAHIIHDFTKQNSIHKRYSKILEKNYRLYQLDNLIRWVFIRHASGRHKAARFRNVILAAARVNRKNLAIELKHMSNEVVKAKQNGFDYDQRIREIQKTISRNVSSNNWKKTPVFIISRDRLSPLMSLLEWLESCEMKNIIIIDNDSIYPPLVSFLNNTSYQVIRTGKNIGHTVVWHEGFAKTLFPGDFYIVTDPDVIPDDTCPKDAVEYFYNIHGKFLDHQKVGFGLQIDDLPQHYALKDNVVKWESQFWKTELSPGVYEASVDTTFALYKPYTDYYILGPSIRTGRPYTAKHLPWYVDSSKIDGEEAFYRLHASQDITSWNTNKILERYKKEMKL